MALLTRAGIIPVAAAGIVLARILPRILTLILPRILARILARMRRRWRAIVAAIVPVIVTAVWWPVTVMVRRRWLPRNRGLHIWLAGSWHGHIRIAAPRISVWIDLRGHKERAVILLLWGAGRHYRRNNIACSWVAVLSGNAPVGKSIAL